MSMTAKPMRSGPAEVNGARLYCEVRGRGPTVMCISGGGQDASEFEQIAQGLADEFTVVTYDRRGFSRSPRPEGWTATSIPEQADDAAALLEALRLAPAAVFGTSSGGIILLDLVARRPEVLRGALVHEPPLIGVLPNAAQVGARLRGLIEQGLASGGPRAAMELFMRTNGGDAVYEAIPPDMLERVLGNAETFFQLEMPAAMAYMPNAEAIATARVPVVPLAGAGSRETFLYETTRWLAEQVGTKVVDLPGGHAGFIDHPAEAAGILRPLLRRMA